MDTLFFIAAKLGWAIVSPDSLLVILCVAAWMAALTGRKTLARQLSALAAFAVIIIGFLPVGEWLISPLERRFPANTALPLEAEGIIVLGGALSPVLSEAWQQPQLNESADRLTNFYYLANLYPNAHLVFSGGSGSLTQQTAKEADSAFNLFNQLNLKDRAIIYESTSRNTVENVGNTKALLNPSPDDDWILVTSAFHMPRSVGIFCQQQWSVTPYPVDHRSQRFSLLRLNFDFARNLTLLKIAMREWVGLVAYRVMGHTEQFLPEASGPCLTNS